ncbi:MAG TPA: tripartite tricarboxylate transporter substrate binding protein [Xanthobacteraceae bacterium]|nr:tripartite tricarboxylate transporter substrate binding protein [Xanthobacteraceae bacterium]
MPALRWIICALSLAVVARGASAQDFPTRPVTLVVPYAAGGNVDISARALQAGLDNALGQPIVVENRPGASGTIAGQYVARAAPDGYTLLVGSNGPIMLAPMTMPNPPYQWQQAFAPISTLAVATNVLVVRPTLPVKSVAELVDYARKNPGKLTVAIDSVASINHFMGALFRLKSGITWTEVHYRGNAPAVTDLIAGHVDVGFLQLVDAAPHLTAGTLRALAILAPQRAPSLPDVPSIGEAGYPDVQGITFNGVFAPKATPRPVIDKLSAAIRGALAKTEVADRLAALGSTARGSTPEEFAAFLARESAKWKDVMQRANIKVTE